jgi:hypothetical protein
MAPFLVSCITFGILYYILVAEYISSRPKAHDKLASVVIYFGEICSIIVTFESRTTSKTNGNKR